MDSWGGRDERMGSMPEGESNVWSKHQQAQYLQGSNASSPWEFQGQLPCYHAASDTSITGASDTFGALYLPVSTPSCSKKPRENIGVLGAFEHETRPILLASPLARRGNMWEGESSVLPRPPPANESSRTSARWFLAVVHSD